MAADQSATRRPNCIQASSRWATVPTTRSRCRDCRPATTDACPRQTHTTSSQTRVYTRHSTPNGNQRPNERRTWLLKSHDEVVVVRDQHGRRERRQRREGHSRDAHGVALLSTQPYRAQSRGQRAESREQRERGREGERERERGREREGRERREGAERETASPQVRERAERQNRDRHKERAGGREGGREGVREGRRGTEREGGRDGE